MKTCTKCSQTKELSEFYKNKTCKDGHTTQCKACIREHVRTNWYPKNREKRVKSCRDYKKRKKTQLLATRHGVPLEQVEKALEDSNGLCEICGKESKLFLDHCHDSLDVRGMLCQTCNSALGFLGDKKDVILSLLPKIEDYLNKSKED